MRRLENFLLLVIPVAFCFTISYLHGRWVGNYEFVHTDRVYWVTAYSILTVATSYGVGLPDDLDRRINALFASAGAAIAAALGISVIQLGFGNALLPRSVILFTALFTTAWGLISSAITGDLRSRKAEATRVVLVGDSVDTAAVASELAKAPERDARIVATLTPSDAVTQLVDTVASQNAHLIVLDRQAQGLDELIRVCADLHQSGKRIRTLSLFYEEWLGKLPLSDLQQISLMFDVGELHRTYYARQRRALDVLMGLVLLLITAVVAIPIFVLNLFLNRGDLFFSQHRVGRYGKIFTIYKFRTMQTVSGAGTEWTGVGDQRFTAFGRLLRKVHLDEFPQSWNLIRGDLSLIGPRPEQPMYVESLQREVPFYNFRSVVRPGITGWAQIKFQYAASTEDTREKLQYDFFYLRRQGFALDALIAIRTLRAIFLGRGR